MRRLTRYTKTAALIAAAALLVRALDPGNDPAREDAAAMRHHCQMVTLWHDTAGQYGWPDYNATAHLCADHGDDESPDTKNH